MASESTKPDPSPEANPTFADMEDAIAIAIEMMERRQKAQSDSLMTALANMIDAKLGPIIDKVNEHTTTLEERKAQPQAAAPHVERKSLSDLVADAKPLIELLREQGIIGKPESTELDRGAILVRRIIDREALKVTRKIIGQGLSKNTLMKDEVVEVLGNAIEDHPPV